jgi:hypothetical protein
MRNIYRHAIRAYGLLDEQSFQAPSSAAAGLQVSFANLIDCVLVYPPFLLTFFFFNRFITRKTYIVVVLWVVHM